MSDVYGDPPGTTEQWRVHWFPPDTTVLYQWATSEDGAKKIAASHAEWHPIIETRTVTVGEWRTV